MPQKRPNILLLMTDQMRGDCLGIAGHPDVKTPYLDHLASQGQWFPNAYTAVPSCIASRCSLLTGLCPEHHGRVGYQDRVDWKLSRHPPRGAGPGWVLHQMRGEDARPSPALPAGVSPCGAP